MGNKQTLVECAFLEMAEGGNFPAGSYVQKGAQVEGKETYIAHQHSRGRIFNPNPCPLSGLRPVPVPIALSSLP